MKLDNKVVKFFWCHSWGYSDNTFLLSVSNYNIVLLLLLLLLLSYEIKFLLEKNLIYTVLF